MKTTTRQSVRRRGAALVLAVVVTVLLAVVGVMFVMVARVGEMQTGAVIDNADLDAAVQSVTARIQQTLAEDLFGENLNEPIGKSGPEYTFAGNDPDNPAKRVNPWLASLEPKDDAGVLKWPFISEIIQSSITVEWDRQPQIVPDYQKMTKIVDGKEVLLTSDEVQKLYADADGDGVADSRWIQLPNTFTSRGKPIFAAVRIIDNCAMLNLNTAFGFYQKNDGIPWHSKPWFVSELHANNNLPYEPGRESGNELGRILGEVNYGPFLRGDDRGKIQRIRLGRNTDMNISPGDYYNQAIRNIESPSGDYRLFDLGDELEMRNRFLLTSLAQARFEREGVAYNTFDWGRGEFVGGWNVPLRVKRTVCEDNDDLNMWRIRLNPANFDDTGNPVPTHPFYYDRRHISTFYSFDRPLRTGQYPLLEAALEKIYKQLIDGGMKKKQAVERLRKIEFVFRPLDNRPLDLRAMTSPAEPARITANTRHARRNVLHLLYGLRAAYMAQGMAASVAAKAACQFVVNLIDYCDDDAATTNGVFGSADYGSQINKNPTYLNQTLIHRMISEVSENDPLVVGNSELDFGLELTETLYGFERQPFISEVYSFNDGTGVKAFALELINPYNDVIVLNGWNVQVGTQENKLDNSYIVPAASVGTLGRLVIYSGSIAGFTPQASDKQRAGFGLGTPMNIPDGILRLQRPDPVNAGQLLTVDAITETERLHLITTTVAPAFKAACRDDAGWKFANRSAYTTKDSVQTLGQPNAIAATGKGYQLPVANSGTIERLTDFLKIAAISNQKGGATPKTITEQVADAVNESAIRPDLLNDGHKKILDYICFLNRPQGSLPGRININTAAVHVIAAAIPPQLVVTVGGTENALTLAQKIVDNRPYERISDLLKIDEFKKFADTTKPENVGDQLIRGDFEERDWIVSRLANIFTVRSDTFTAYILVRLGADGPQRRMIAIFDRTNVWTKDDRPRLVALHPVPDPR